MKHKKKRREKAYQPGAEQPEEEARQEQTTQDLLIRKVRGIWRAGMLVLLVLIVMTMLATPTMGALILLPFVVGFAVIVMALAGIPGKKVLAAALQPANGKNKRTICALLVAIPYLALSIHLLSAYTGILRDYNGDDPAVWTERFYENEDLLNEVNRTMMNPEGKAGWYIAELHAAVNDSQVEIVVAEQGTGIVIERGMLRSSQVLDDAQAEKIRSLLKNLRVPDTEVDFEYNEYLMWKHRGVYARFTIDAENMPSHLTDYQKHYEAGTWFLWGVTREQQFDDPPAEYYSYLPDQKTEPTTPVVPPNTVEEAPRSRRPLRYRNGRPM